MKKYLLFIIILIFSLFPSTVFAEEDLSITRWIVGSLLQENGDLQISEDITFKFNDKFNGVFRNIVIEDTDGIANIELYEMVQGIEVPYNLDTAANKGDSGVYSYEQDKNEINLMIFSPSDDEEKTFRLNYTILNVAIMHSDTGEFYYKYLGDENETTISYFSATLALPKLDKENVSIFAHGPLNGNINFIDNELIKLEVSNVPSNTFVEARVLYPTDTTPLSNNVGFSNLESILDEEVSFAIELEEKAEDRERVKGIFNKISLGIIAVGAILVGFIFKSTRRDPSIYENMNSLYPKDLSPAELNLFMNQAIDSRGLMATIFDLTRREYISIDDALKDESNGKNKNLINKNFKFIRSNRTDADLLDHERYLMHWLFNDIGDGHRVTTMEINESRIKNRVNFFKSNNEWNKLVNVELKNKEYLDEKSIKAGIKVLIFSIVVFIFGIISLIYNGIYGIGVLIVALILFVYGIILQFRKSDEGFIQYGLWRDFKKEFNNYEDINIDIPKDKTLIYAVALGISMKKLDDHRRIYGRDYYPMYWGYWYFLSINNKGGSAFEDKFNNSFYGSTGTSTPNSASFGGGGGFSAGGGGGVGGGGAGGF